MRTILTLVLFLTITLGYGQQQNYNFVAKDAVSKVKPTSNKNNRLYKRIGFKNINNVLLSENQRKSFMGNDINILSELIEDDVLKLTYSHDEDEYTKIFLTNIKNVFVIKLHSKVKVVFILHIIFNDGSDEHFSFIEPDAQLKLFKLYNKI